MTHLLPDTIEPDQLSLKHLEDFTFMPLQQLPDFFYSSARLSSQSEANAETAAEAVEDQRQIRVFAAAEQSGAEWSGAEHACRSERSAH